MIVVEELVALASHAIEHESYAAGAGVAEKEVMRGVSEIVEPIESQCRRQSAS